MTLMPFVTTMRPARVIGRWRARRRPVAQAGQALIELLIGATVLVPFVVLLVWLGKVQSLQQAANAAARVLAFECSVRPDACAQSSQHPELADEIRRRVFARADTGIFSTDRMPEEAAASERNPLWTDAAGRPLIERFGHVGVRVDAERFDAGLSVSESRAGAVAANALEVLSRLAGPGRFGLEIQGGLVNARIQVDASRTATADRFSTQLVSIPLAVRAHVAVLTDAWNASGPTTPGGRSVEARVSGGRQLDALYEASIDARYLPVRGFLSLMGLIGLEPNADAFRYHNAELDVVPADRIAVEPQAPTAPAPSDPRDPRVRRRSTAQALPVVNPNLP